MKKITCAILLVCLLGALAVGSYGCKKKTDYNPDNFLTAEQALAEYGNEYRIVKDPITIRIFVMKHSMHGDWEEMKVWKKLSEMTNINFEFEEVEGSAYATKRTLVWENKKELPDLFMFNNSIHEQVMYSKFGAIVPWNDDNFVTTTGVNAGNLIDNYMPNYKSLMAEHEMIKKVATLDDGKMYSLVSINDVPRDLTVKMWLNKTWIENVNESEGLNLPTDADDIDTIEKLYEILTAFKKYDANRNGKAGDEIPYSAVSCGSLMNMISSSLGYVQNETIEMENDETGFTYVPTTDANRKALEIMNKWYREGLIDNETYELTQTQVVGKARNDLVGMFEGSAPFLTVGETLDDKYEYICVGPFESQYYNENNQDYVSKYSGPLQYSFSGYSANAALIPSSTPYVREIARMMDILYSEKGISLYAYGEEGVDFIWQDEEKTSWLMNKGSENAGMNDEEWRATLTPNVGYGNSFYWNWDFVKRDANPDAVYLNTESERYLPYLKEGVPSWIIMSEEELDEGSLIATTLSNYVSIWHCKFVKYDPNKTNNNEGAELTDANWNNYKKILTDAKCNRLNELYNQAYERCKAKFE